MKFVVPFLLSAFMAFGVQAKEVAGVQVAPSIELAGKTLNLNGAGVRSKFFIDLYVGSLYTPAVEKTAAAILDGKVPAAMRLTITSGLITSDKMIATIAEGFKDSTGGKTAPLQERITRFMDVFAANAIKEGDSFTLFGKPGNGVVAYRNGKEVITIEGDDFRKALFGIWLGKDPVSDDLKGKLLGQ